MKTRDRILRFFGRGGSDELNPWIRVILVVAILALGMAMGRFAQENEIVREVVAQYGYAGVFVIALVSGFNLVVPVPAVAFIPLFAASGLDLVVTVGIIVVGVTVADMLAFMLGRAGSELHVMRGSGLVKKLQKVRVRHYWWPLGIMFLYASFAPLPNEVMAIPMGLMGYPPRHMIWPLLLGNLVFNTVAALGIMTLFAGL